MTRGRGERGSTVVTALLAATVMLMLGTALLAVVDQQARESGQSRDRDRSFNLAESVLSTEAFVLGRHWPVTAPPANPVCSAAGAGLADTIRGSTPASEPVQRLRRHLDDTYDGRAYDGATWQVNVCDDVDGDTVWGPQVLTQPSWDANQNNRLWVRAQTRVRGKPRVLVGLVRVRDAQVLDERYGLVAGRVTDDLGSTVNGLGPGVLGRVLDGLFATAPTVAADPQAAAGQTSGVTGVRCGALDLKVLPPVTCLAGTLGSTSAVPVISTLVTGGRLVKYPQRAATTTETIDKLRALASATHTNNPSSQGGNSPATAPACTFTGDSGTRSATTVVFVERVGDGDQWCVLDVGAGMQFKALIVGSGRVVVRGNDTPTGTPTASTAPQPNTFSGVLYALNLQRLPVDEGGMGLGDASAPGREIVRIDRGGHVKGTVYVDGRSGRAGIYPPEFNLNSGALVDSLIPCVVVLGLRDCTLRNTLKALGVDALVNRLVDILGATAVANAISGQLDPQRAQYGSAIVSDVAAVGRLRVFGASGVVAGTFKDLPAR